MKRLIITILLLLALCGCEQEGEYPYLEYVPTMWTVDVRKIEIRDGYVLSDGHSYDAIETEDGYDLVLHFVKEDTDG